MSNRTGRRTPGRGHPGEGRGASATPGGQDLVPGPLGARGPAGPPPTRHEAAQRLVGPVSLREGARADARRDGARSCCAMVELGGEVDGVEVWPAIAQPSDHQAGRQSSRRRRRSRISRAAPLFLHRRLSRLQRAIDRSIAHRCQAAQGTGKAHVRGVRRPPVRTRRPNAAMERKEPMGPMCHLASTTSGTPARRPACADPPLRVALGSACRNEFCARARRCLELGFGRKGCHRRHNCEKADAGRLGSAGPARDPAKPLPRDRRCGWHQCS